jgi:DNA-binding MarR family transcriptional regulator
MMWRMRDPLDAASFDPEQLDVVLTALFAGLALNEQVAERIRVGGFPDVRFSHGFVFQHLVPGPLPVGELARRMGVSQQAASKAAAELERLGYLERVLDPADARVRRLALSARGRDAIAAGRTARAEVAAELEKALGARRTATLRRALLDALEAAGGIDAVRARRVPPVR